MLNLETTERRIGFDIKIYFTSMATLAKLRPSTSRQPCALSMALLTESQVFPT